MSISVYYRPSSGSFTEFIWLELYQLPTGRYRVGGSTYLNRAMTDTDKHRIVITESNEYCDYLYRDYWKIVNNSIYYCWFLDLIVKKYAVSTLPFVLHYLPGLSTNVFPLSVLHVKDGNNYCVRTGSSGGMYSMQYQENDAYKSFLRDVSLASLV